MTEQRKEQANPKVRPLEAFPLQVEGKEMFGLKDPIGIAPEIVFVPPEVFFLISLMDGSNGLRDMQAAYMRKYGTLLFSDKIAELIVQLDSYFLLENRHFADHLQRLRDAFKEAGIEIPFPQRDLHLRSVEEDILDHTSSQKEKTIQPVKGKRKPTAK